MDRYSFVKNNKQITFIPLTPKQVYKDQLKMKIEKELKKMGEAESFKKDENNESKNPREVESSRR